MTMNENTLESGNIYFLHRPLLEEDFPDGGADVQRFFMVLNPQDSRLYRLAVLGRKNDAIPNSDCTIWGFIKKIAASAEQIEGEIDPKKLHTKSRHERQSKSPRLMGQGFYRIYRQAGTMFLAYVLDLYQDSHTVASSLSIEPEAAFAIKVKNPFKPSPRGIGLHLNEVPEYPDRLSKLFEDRRYFNANLIEFLNYQGTGLLLTAADQHVSEAVDTQLQFDCQDFAVSTINDLKEQKQYCLPEPLIRGRWR